MTRFKLIFVSSFLVLVTIACQVSTFSSQAPATLTPSNLSVEPTDTPAKLPPIQTDTPQPSPSPSTIPATSSPFATATAISEYTSTQLRVFEDLWKIVDSNYLYDDFNGLEWDAIYLEYRARIESGLTNKEFYAAMDEMIYRLGDEHSVYLSPNQAAAEDLELSGNKESIDIGILSAEIPERSRLAIVVVYPYSPAEEAGLKPHDSILAVNGQAIHNQDGFQKDLFHGPEGTLLELTVQSPGEEPRQVQVERRRIKGPVPISYLEMHTPQEKRIGYLLLPTFADETIDEQVEEALRSLTAELPLDGLILDTRQNSGGTDSVTSNILSFFTRGSLGFFEDRYLQQRDLSIIGADINGSTKLPLVVLISHDTISFGEIFAGVLKDAGRAYLIGDRTAGNVELLWRYDFEDGSRAWIAQETFRPRKNPRQDWERTGILPDLFMPSDWDEFKIEEDPAISAALRFFDKP